MLFSKHEPFSKKKLYLWLYVNWFHYLILTKNVN